MKRLFTFLLFCFIFSTVKSQFSTQYFEGAQTSTSLAVVVSTSTNNIWQKGKPAKTLFSSASSTPNVIVTDTINYYPKSNISTFTVIACNTQTFIPSPFKLQWKQKLDMDSKKDGGIVEFSTNSGGTWQNAHNNPNAYQFYGFQPANKDTINTNEYCFSGTDNVWRDLWLCLSPTIGNSNDTILYRFTFKSDSINTNKEGWMLDNFVASKTIIHPVKEISNIGDILVYPNVTNGIINVEMKKTASTDVIDNIELINEDGKVIERFGQNYSKVVLDISKHKAGLYYLRVTINKKVNKFKILYEKN